MKRTHLNKIIYLLLLLFLFSGCGRHCDFRDTYYFAQKEREYLPDTTVSSFKMIDNHGITEAFYVDKSEFYPQHHFFSIWGIECSSLFENFAIAYHSSLNDYFLSMVMRAGIQSTSLEIEWNQRNRFQYDFGTNKVTDGIAPEITFFDSLLVNGSVYHHILEIDYTKKIDQIDDRTPLKTYISGNEGLIKLITKDNITIERIK